MEFVYKFTAYNTETIYGFGTEEEAITYQDWLNRDRQINLYERAVSELSDEQADTLAINIRENLNDLELIDSSDN